MEPREPEWQEVVLALMLAIFICWGAVEGVLWLMTLMS